MDHDEDSSGSTHKLIHAHAALCASAVLAFWPIGVMLLRYWKEPSMAVRIHQWVQVAGFTVYVAGFVLGVILWTRLKTDLGSSPTLHGVLGVVITGLACVQLLLGWWHHKLWQRESAKRGNARWVKAPERTWVAWMHMSFGWFVILIGIANGGIGFHQVSIGSDYQGTNDIATVLPYSILATIIGSLVIGTAVFSERRRQKRVRHQRGVADAGVSHEAELVVHENHERAGEAQDVSVKSSYGHTADKGA